MIERLIEKSHSHAGLLGREEGLKQVRLDVILESRAGVGHLDFDHVVGDPGIGRDQLPPRALRHRFERVAEQVDQDLLNLHPVGQHQIGLRIQIEAKLDVLFARSGKSERSRLLDQLRQAFDALFGFAARNEVAKPADDLTGAKRLLGGAVHGIFDLRLVGVGAAGEQPARAFHVVADGGERLVEFVRECGCHLAHRAQARNVHQFGLQFLQARLGLLMLGEVAHEAGEVGVAAGLHLADRKMHRKGRSIAALAGHDASDADDVAFAGRAVARDVAVVARPVGFGHQLADVLADGFVFGIAEQSLGGGAEKLNDAVTVDDDHGVRHGVEDRAQVAFARPQRLFDLLLFTRCRERSR